MNKKNFFSRGERAGCFKLKKIPCGIILIKKVVEGGGEGIEHTQMRITPPQKNENTTISWSIIV